MKMKKNKTIGDSVELKNGRTGIIEDYDDTNFFVKDSNGASYKVKKDSLTKDEPIDYDTWLLSGSGGPYDEDGLTDEEILDRIQIDYSEAEIEGDVVLMLDCKDFTDEKLKELITNEDYETEAEERTYLLEDLGFALQRKIDDCDFEEDVEENAISFIVFVNSSFLGEDYLTVDENKSEVLDYSEQKDSRSYDLDAKIKLNVTMTKENLEKFLKASDIKEELISHFTVAENDIYATAKGGCYDYDDSGYDD